MPGIMTRLCGVRLPLCCRPPVAPTGLTADPGGGSSEVQITWDPVASAVSHYRVYRRKSPGQFDLLAVVTGDALGTLVAGRLGIVDAPDYWPWPSGADAGAERSYAVSALSTRGLEGPMSVVVSAIPL